MTNPDPVRITVSPEPTEDEMAVIVAAYRQLWSEPGSPPPIELSTRWKFSGRWWVHQPARRRLR